MRSARARRRARATVEIASSCREPQAVIVCGDIDAARIRERMELLSMMVPSLEDSFQNVE